MPAFFAIFYVFNNFSFAAFYKSWLCGNLAIYKKILLPVYMCLPVMNQEVVAL